MRVRGKSALQAAAAALLVALVCSALGGEAARTSGSLAPLKSVPVEPYTYTQSGSDWDGVCSSSKQQSPINLVVKPNSGLDSHELEVHYPVISSYEEGLVLEHKGSALQIDVDSTNVGYLMNAGHRYYVRNVTFRAPSEHTVSGVRFPLEMQITHVRANSDEKVVVSALFQVSDESNPFLDSQLEWRHLPHEQGLKTTLTAPFQLGSGVVGLFGGYYSYEGSTTEPPCAEGVWWHVLETVQAVSMRQLNAINALFKNNMRFAGGLGNNRAVQPTNGRSVVLHNHHALGDGDGRPVVASGDVNPEGFTPPKHVPDGETPSPEDPPQIYDRATNATFDEKAGPAHVPKLYAKGGREWSGYCATSRFQSPIDIRLQTGNPHGDFDLKIGYRPAMPKRGVENVGYSIRVRADFGSVKVFANGRWTKFHASEITLHSPSEHLIDGRQAALEVNILHTTNASVPAERQHAVVSVLFHEDETSESTFLANLGILDLPVKAMSNRELKQAVNLLEMDGLADMYRFGFYSYAGSLTVPPCSPDVKRFVARRINDVSTLQLKAFRKLFYGNNRAVQPLNGRGVNVRAANTAKDVNALV